MARTATVVLDDKSYTVHAFNIGELEQITEAMSGPSTGKVAFTILALALKRATPSVNDEDFRNLEPTSTEIQDAVKIIMQLSGMEEKPSGPPA